MQQQSSVPPGRLTGTNTDQPTSLSMTIGDPMPAEIVDEGEHVMTFKMRLHNGLMPVHVQYRKGDLLLGVNGEFLGIKDEARPIWAIPASEPKPKLANIPKAQEKLILALLSAHC